MIKRQVAAWFIGWVMIVGFQFLVYLHRSPFYQGDFSRRDVAGGAASPIELPWLVRGALWDSAPVVLFPLRNVVMAAGRTGLTKFYAGEGWQGLVRRVVSPFPPPARSELNDAAHQAQHLKHLRREALWFSALNSLIWVACIVASLRLLRRCRHRKRLGSGAARPDDIGTASAEESS